MGKWYVRPSKNCSKFLSTFGSLVFNEGIVLNSCFNTSQCFCVGFGQVCENLEKKLSRVFLYTMYILS